MGYNRLMNITILGAGAFGTALGNILEKKNHHIIYYAPHLQISLEDALKDARLAILAVPSKVAPYLIPKLPHELPLIVATKGILTLNLFQDFKKVSALSGPGFANDINHEHPTHLTATSPKVRDLFTTSWLDFDLTSDFRGVLLCGALKNIYAIYAGLHNLKPGTKAHEEYLFSAAEEMKAILYANDANPKTVDLNCGIGDLRITCAYPSRNYEFGQKLILDPNYQPEKTVEGVTALSRVKRGDLKLPKTAFIMRELIKESDKWA